jgi:hypothetical protein
MIQGFETREVTDKPIRAFVKSANGILHKKTKQVDQYEKTEWLSFKNFDLPIAVFGSLRGTGDLIKNCLSIPQIFYYFDHAYHLGTRHSNNNLINDRIYRIVKNDYNLTYIDELNDTDRERIEKYKKHIEMKPWKKEGRYILVLAPSQHMKKYFNMPDWVEDTVAYLKHFTKRDIVIRTKETKETLEKQLQEAYACVSFQSTGCIDALLQGVPSFCDGMSCGQPVSKLDIAEIENPIYPDNREKWIDSLLANQFTLREIENGIAYEKVSRNNVRLK